MNDLMLALETILNIQGMLYLFIGVALGVLVGALPGLTATMAIAVLLPFTFNAPLNLGLMLLLGVYNGAIYGGSISAILTGIPGTPAAVVTAFDGNAMAEKGEAGKAIGLATIASFIGGFLSTIALAVGAPILGLVTSKFGSPEFFMLAIFGLAAIVSASKESMIKGTVSGLLGILIAMIGVDSVTSIPRFTFGWLELELGLAFVPMMIGLFGMSEVLNKTLHMESTVVITQKLKGLLPSKRELSGLMPTILKGSGLGILVGAIPGEGASVASLLAYNDTKSRAKDPDSFGKGNPKGIVAPESANNAVTGGSLIPMLTMGIPGNSTTAILMGAFMMHNVVPGPLLFKNSLDLIYTIFIGMAIANVFMLIIGLGGAPFFARLLTLPTGVLLPAIATFSIVGSYAVNNSLFDVGLMLVFGVIGFALRRGGFPIAPMVLGLILAPIAESSLRRTILISDGDWLYFLQRPVALLILMLTVLSLVLPYISKIRKSKNSGGNSIAMKG
ncbi:tripartite tricarboxylate transporter permease [Tepidibacillus sp. HK-1]|uniref:tripartite tricarboxylate transporter permease n=1 Tax=Tepidibacillus sp. HK-1 TaxID=1883407 RepID=UPI0008586350|nr:tripartite tricarboxylate transporter permease [Tepidibacillus sp. HK-1]GBF12234.1 tripartite tricarboxylate transporter TctA family protein [Tepidibacillus sp. HK-1]